MKEASELTPVSPDHAVWHVYEPAVKAELFSTAVRIDGNMVVVDPIPLAAEARLELGNVTAVVVTNANHIRAAAAFADPDSLCLPSEVASDFPTSQYLADGMHLHGLTTVAISGAAPGEFAFYDPRGGGALIVGDALINFEPHGFSLLPTKYCVDRRQMIRSLRNLLDFSFSRVFFAHGAPVIKRARDRLAALLRDFS